MGVAIMAAGTDAAAYSNNYIPPVASPLVWGNLRVLQSLSQDVAKTGECRR